MITPVQVTVPVPSVPMPAWAHWLLLILIASATAIGSSITVYGPGLGLSMHAIAFIASGSTLLITVLRAIDALSESVVKNVAIIGSVASTSGRKLVTTKAAITAVGEPVPERVPPPPPPPAVPPPDIVRGHL